MFAYTNTAGSKTFTFTSGAATATQVVKFALPSTDADVDSWSVSAPASVLPGSTLSVVASLVDEYGNAVTGLTVSVSKTGPGLLVATLPTVTGTTGIMNLGVLLGANDSGSVVFTFTFGSGASAITETVTIRVGSAAAVAGTARAWTRAMGDGTVKLYARDVVGAGKVQFFHNGREVAWIRAVDATDPKLNVVSDGMVRTRALVSGRNVFEIKVNGVQLVRRIATGS